MNLLGNRFCLTIYAPRFWRSAFPYPQGGKELFTHLIIFFNWRLQQGNCLTVISLLSVQITLSSYVLLLQLTVFLLPKAGSKDNQAEVCTRKSCCIHRSCSIALLHAEHLPPTFAHAVTRSARALPLMWLHWSGAVWAGGNATHCWEILVWYEILRRRWVGVFKAEPAGIQHHGSQLIFQTGHKMKTEARQSFRSENVFKLWLYSR